MGSPTYRFTSGRMLHFEDCEHFFDDMPPRLATEEELRDLPVCGTCAGQSGYAAGTSPADARFTCPNCHMSVQLSVKTASGLCRDCAQDVS